MVINAPVVYASLVDMESMNKKYALLKAQARNGEKKGEVLKHRSPQIKRSTDILMDCEYLIEDINEPLDNVISSFYKSSSVKGEDLLLMKEKLKELSGIVSNEILMNKMASKSDYAWKTVKMFETDSLFTGDDADVLTNKLRVAEGKAGRASFRAKRARFSGGLSRAGSSRGAGRGGYQNVNFNGANFNSASDRSFNNAAKFNNFNVDKSKDLCWKCNLPGHRRAECPGNK